MICPNCKLQCKTIYGNGDDEETFKCQKCLDTEFATMMNWFTIVVVSLIGAAIIGNYFYMSIKG